MSAARAAGVDPQREAGKWEARRPHARQPGPRCAATGRDARPVHPIPGRLRPIGRSGRCVAAPRPRPPEPRPRPLRNAPPGQREEALAAGAGQRQRHQRCGLGVGPQRQRSPLQLPRSAPHAAGWCRPEAAPPAGRPRAPGRWCWRMNAGRAGSPAPREPSAGQLWATAPQSAQAGESFFPGPSPLGGPSRGGSSRGVSSLGGASATAQPRRSLLLPLRARAARRPYPVRAAHPSASDAGIRRDDAMRTSAARDRAARRVRPRSATRTPARVTAPVPERCDATGRPPYGPAAAGASGAGRRPAFPGPGALCHPASSTSLSRRPGAAKGPRDPPSQSVRRKQVTRQSSAARPDEATVDPRAARRERSAGPSSSPPNSMARHGSLPRTGQITAHPAGRPAIMPSESATNLPKRQFF